MVSLLCRNKKAVFARSKQARKRRKPIQQYGEPSKISPHRIVAFWLGSRKSHYNKAVYIVELLVGQSHPALRFSRDITRYCIVVCPMSPHQHLSVLTLARHMIPDV